MTRLHYCNFGADHVSERIISKLDAFEEVKTKQEAQLCRRRETMRQMPKMLYFQTQFYRTKLSSLVLDTSTKMRS